MALRSIPQRLKTAPSSRIKRVETAGGYAKAHYQTSTHHAWADAVKHRDGFRCVDCGATSQAARLIADHIDEIADGGLRLDIANGKTLCIACHNRKTAEVRRLRF